MSAQRVAEQAIMICDAVLATLDGQQLLPGDIHRIRVAVKRLRAMWHLMRPAIDAGAWHGARARLRRAHRMLAPLRDQQVAIESLAKLAHDTKRGAEARVISRYLHRLETSRDAHVAVEQLGTDLTALFSIERLAWSASGAGPARIAQGYRRCCRRARRGFKVAARTHAATDYHDLRRWVKYLAFQLQCLNTPAVAVERDLIRLGDLLGRLNDLHELRRTDRRALHARDRDTLRSLLKRRIRKLRRRVDRRGKALFGHADSILNEVLPLPGEQVEHSSNIGLVTAIPA